MPVSSDATGLQGNSASVSSDSMADNRAWLPPRVPIQRPPERVKVERPQRSLWTNHLDVGGHQDKPVTDRSQTPVPPSTHSRLIEEST